ncbi:MAG: helix-turn-helix domain-containing protein [Proteobacteria bacterium]|nr:helix-turn-helix domain-containing protein [Pseudomonadota bacterium]MDA1064700.1 helix-turn-helix domain-containing protein [Pseudomonadota bacterium]
MSKRSYRQNCSLAHGADLLGERWTLLILRELLIQPCQFGQLSDYLKGIGTNLLAQRLKELEAIAQIEKQEPGGKRAAYCLTANGKAVEPVILEMIRWGYRFGVSDPEYLHWHHWDLLAMRAYFQPARCRRRIAVQFASPALTAWVRISPDRFEHGLGQHAAADLQVPTTIIDFQQDIQAGKYDDDALVREFVACFALPLR